jgi:hypothetical protein
MQMVYLVSQWEDKTMAVAVDKILPVAVAVDTGCQPLSIMDFKLEMFSMALEEAMVAAQVAQPLVDMD